jgi:CHASE3 domain sensor protein
MNFPRTEFPPLKPSTQATDSTTAQQESVSKNLTTPTNSTALIEALANANAAHKQEMQELIEKTNEVQKQQISIIMESVTIAHERELQTLRNKMRDMKEFFKTLFTTTDTDNSTKSTDVSMSTTNIFDKPNRLKTLDSHDQSPVRK